MNREEFIKAATNKEMQDIYNVCSAYSKAKYNKEFTPELFNNMANSFRHTNTGIDHGGQWLGELYEEAKGYFMRELVIITMMNKNNIILKYY